MLRRRSKWIVVFVCITLFFCLGQRSVVHAGEINANEARVLGVAQGTFEYNGETYVAQPGYVSQLSGKLMETDLSADQADEAISQIYANVAAGVEQGYLVKQSGGGSQNADKGDGSEGNSGEGKAGGKEKPEGKDTEEGHASIEDGGNSLQDSADSNANGTAANGRGDANIWNLEDDQGGIWNAAWSFQPPSVIKDTGFDLHQTIYVLVGSGVVFVILCAYVIFDRHTRKSLPSGHFLDKEAMVADEKE